MYLCRKCGGKNIFEDLQNKKFWCDDCGSYEEVRHVLAYDFFDSYNDYPDIEPSFNRRR